MASSHPNHTRFDVFLSFRGEDTRNSFTDHLYEALKRAAIHTFRDNEGIDRGEELWPKIEEGIKESKASIVVLSENYAKSKWCLKELALIRDERKDFGHFVLPVFYKVDPSDVRNHRHSFQIEEVEGTDWTSVNVNRWKDALTEVSNLTGMVAEGRPETDFIARIVDTINHKLDLKLVSTHPEANLTALETRAKYINSWLDNETPGDDDVLAICGMGGGGKTTLAQYIYNSNKQKFASSSFLSHIGLESKQPNGLLKLKKQLINDIVGGNSTTIPLNNVDEGTSKIEEALQINRVLIVLDDIDDEYDLHALLGKSCSNTNSKIIITTSHMSIQSWCMSTCLRCNVYKLELLNDVESLELLSRRAFGSKTPMEGFEDVAAQLAQYCEGNPLALNVLGSSLFTSAEDMQGRKIETWKSTLNLLNSSDGDVHSKIQQVLRRSFDSLPYKSEKELFLHIACFFVGEYKDYVETILETDWHAKSGITTLINRCLLTISPGNKLIMPQLLQKMANKIVNDMSKDPARRSIVWNEVESYRVLFEGEGSETIEGLSLDMRKLKQVMMSEPISNGKTSSVSKMKKLKLLQLIDVGFDGDYNNFPHLRWLCWHKCHLKKIPSGLFMSTLVAIDMSNGECESFELPVDLNSLKILNLKGSHKLASIYNLNRVPYLESLILWDCSNLTYLCTGIGGLKRLTRLDLTGCKMLWNDTEGMRRHFGYLPASLELLFLNNFFPGDSAYFPVVKSDQLRPQARLYINLGNNQFKFPPKSIHNFELRVLDLTCCPNLEVLTSLPSTLEELYTYRCTSLKKITFQSARFELRKFGYGGCTNLSEIQGLFKLVPIKQLDDANLVYMKWIKQYQDHRMDLVGDEITKRRIWHIQMLYEYGIRSTFVPKDRSMKMPENMMSSTFASFLIAPRSGRRVNGFILTALYRSSGDDANKAVLFAKISNKTKGVTWIYNPVVFGKPKVDEDVVWLSYWPMRNIVEVGDEINVSITGDGLIVTGLAVKCVYASEVEHGHSEKHTKNNIEVIGGDLSEFELTRGVYYLCRRSFFKSTATTDLLKMLIGDHTFDYTELQGWRKSRQTFDDESFMGLQNFRGNHSVANEIVERLPQRQEDKPATLSGRNIYSVLPSQEDTSRSSSRFVNFFGAFNLGR